MNRMLCGHLFQPQRDPVITFGSAVHLFYFIYDVIAFRHRDFCSFSQGDNRVRKFGHLNLVSLLLLIPDIHVNIPFDFFPCPRYQGLRI